MRPQKVLFLDVDGVIRPLRPAGQNSGFDSFLVDNLLTIIRETNTSIVLSSAWRYSGYGYGSILHQCLIGTSGFVAADEILAAIVDACPLDEKPNETRDSIIRRWMVMYGEPVIWVALDDCSDISWLGEGHYVLLDGHLGLTPHDTHICIQLLNGDGYG